MSSDFHVLDASTKQWVRYSCGVESVVRYRGHGVYVPKHSVLLWMAELIVEKKNEDINQTKGSGDSMNKDTEWAMIAFKIGPLKSENHPKSEKRSWTVEAPTGLQLSTMYLGPGSDDSILGCGYSKNGVFKVYSLSRFVDGEWRWTKLASIEIDVNISKYIPITSFMKTEEEMYLCLLMDDSSIMAFRSLYPVTEKWLSMVLFSDMPGKFHAAYFGSRNFLMDMKTEGPKQQTKMQRGVRGPKKQGGPKKRLLKQD
uniref:uncharacterized protein LOC105352563 n=1 Tax=Fragaria vesca subsp. vesca TaxID=101020 RepID=UPI0005C9AFC1|nr:PREDICTED: uncharacterized protein LOC105352563 [Fragaria vesca subsp. vesca]